MDLSYLSRLSVALRQRDACDSLADSMSSTQLTSKRWLVQTLQKYAPQAPRILILGGWFGTYTVPLLQEIIKPQSITLNDIDNRALEIAKELHPGIEISGFDVETSIDQIHHMDVDIIINTSCEHMVDMSTVTNHNENCIFALQSCDNANDPGHINVPKDSTEFLHSTGINRVFFSGRLNLGHKNRFMVIGQK